MTITVVTAAALAVVQLAYWSVKLAKAIKDFNKN
jgi:hypothetical protein